MNPATPSQSSHSEVFTLASRNHGNLEFFFQKRIRAFPRKNRKNFVGLSYKHGGPFYKYFVFKVIALEKRLESIRLKFTSWWWCLYAGKTASLNGKKRNMGIRENDDNIFPTMTESPQLRTSKWPRIPPWLCRAFMNMWWLRPWVRLVLQFVEWTLKRMQFSAISYYGTREEKQRCSGPQFRLRTVCCALITHVY